MSITAIGGETVFINRTTTFHEISRARCCLQVVAALRGEEELPWEGTLSGAVAGKLGALRAPILSMLHRDPSLRPSMAAAHSSIVNMERT